MALETEHSPLDLLQAGFDGRPPPPARPRPSTQLWRIGRWLRSQGARRPRAVRVVNDGTAIVDGRILAVDVFGSIQDLSTTRRVVRTPLSSWKPI
jgi:hypothetical protein